MSITEPFALANYNTSLYASANADNVSVAVQTDGVHVLQLSTLRPIISRTLGPSTSFACPPLTVSDAHTYTVYAAIQSSQELEDQQVAGKSIWRWSEDLNSSIADRAEAHKKKLSVTVPHTITGLHYVPELAGHIIVIAHNGSITTVQSDTLQVQSTWEQHNGSLDDTLVKSFVFSRTECSFLPRNTSQEGVVIVLVLADPKTDTARLEIVCITNEERGSLFAPIGCCQTDFKQSDILDISFSSTGIMSAITTEGKWRSFTIDQSTGDSFSLSQYADPFRLKNLSFAPHQLTLLPLTSSHVLLAGVSSSTTEIHTHIWDLQYSVILASHVLPIPSSFTSSPVSITLISSAFATSKAKGKDSFTHSQAVIVISNSSPSATKASNGKNKNKTKTGRSSTSVPSALFVVPYVVPIISTIGNAIGKASASATWIALPESSDNASGLDHGRRRVLQAMRTEMEGNRPQAANEAFFNWEKGQPGLDKGPYGYDFVKQVLHVVLQPVKNPASVMYSSMVVRRLIDHKVVSNDMVEGGLVRLLKAKNDWESIKLTLMNVVDVSESELVEALTDVVAKHRYQPGGSNPDAMQVDASSNLTTVKSSSADVPPLPVFLSHCVKYRTTPSHLRVAFRQQLHSATSMTAAECAVEILKVLIKWIEECSSRDIPLFPAAANEGVKTVRKATADGLPEFGQIVSFTETFLDATFLSLLQYKPAQEVLQRLAALLQPEIAFMQSVQPLYGVLGGFSSAQCKVLREAKERETSGGKGPSAGQERQDKQREKRLHEQSVMGIGLYQVEELML